MPALGTVSLCLLWAYVSLPNFFFLFKRSIYSFLDWRSNEWMCHTVSVVRGTTLKKKSPLINALFIKHTSALKNTLKYYVWFKRAWLRLHGLGCRLLSVSMSSKEEPRCWLRLEQREGGHSQMEPLASCLLWDHHVWSNFANVGTWGRTSTQLGFFE